MRKLYYVYDQVADTMMYFCEAAADPVAIRSFNSACQNEFSRVADDLSLYCLGEIVDNEIKSDKVMLVKYNSEVKEHA